MDDTPTTLRERAAECRKRGEAATDPHVKESFFFLATVLEEQAQMRAQESSLRCSIRGES